ncbi:GNAT family N-acetyltransferase [Aquimarina sp. AU474]|uniref:GNAT family N-acetyltransferase n=1 Tax=Aquimarina sp. AU474 TaxID=2108529 RepID=UPI000D69D849|nr:GNAT family N-acetyltransferase [Aquimarina sp. AU474]
MRSTIEYTSVKHKNELLQILELQQKNLPINISKDEKHKEGFVTVKHDIDILSKMNDRQPHIIAKHNDKVVGYTLCMTSDFGNDIEILKPMFAKIEKHLNNSTSYIVMGQVCIDKAYRGKGIFRGLYQTMRNELGEKYDVLITEVAANNPRSLRAHYAIGFTDLLIYNTDDEITWHLIQWDWK